MGSGRRSSFPAWPQFVVFAVAAGYLALRWDAIPPEWASHWDIVGTPNGVSERSVAGVFGPVVLGAAVAGFVESLLLMLPRERDAGDALHPVRAASVYCVRLIMFAIALVLSVAAVALPLEPSVPGVAIAVAALALPGLATALGAGRISAALREVRRSGHGDKVEGYHGLYYASSSDRRLFVPKLTGFGVTINFAHPWAWPAMVLLTGVPIAIVLAIVLATTHR
jgi:uncharacterized membrane protein